ncbi:hypothetical protein CBR_g58779 [Chara braunii]|uniref:Uncharacterized protein n=1 Tax=Chara braunii TaxID=69332 RepID=A0A388MEW2_CHABU|nr:hypothetical protein CBR_g58779 [Chara braunii]|eukprot:GBG93094.1 hypothetical protein CBR_g58779 [Chara braunii]
MGGDAMSFAISLQKEAGCSSMVEYSQQTRIDDFLKLIRERFEDKNLARRKEMLILSLPDRKWKSTSALKVTMDELLQCPDDGLTPAQILNSFARALPDPLRTQFYPRTKEDGITYEKFGKIAIDHILDVIGDVDGPSYVIEIPPHLRTYPVFHASKLLPCVTNELFPSRRSAIPPSMDGKYDVDKIVAESTYHTGRRRRPQRQYKLTPSCVRFSSAGRYVGEAATVVEADCSSEEERSTFVYEIKRLIGKEFDDPSVQELIDGWPFQVVRGPRGEPLLPVSAKTSGTRSLSSSTSKLTPEEISARLLRYCKKMAEDRLGCEVRNAVITVPAYFNDSQRQATRDAGQIARLNVLRLANEPTAGALAYAHRRQVEGGRHSQNSEAQGEEGKEGEKENLLVFDLGGGTFDVSLVEIADGRLTVKALAGDTRLGGADFDKRLIDYFLQQFEAEHGELGRAADVRANTRSMRELRKACVHAKEALSSSEVVGVGIRDFFNGLELKRAGLTRATFEEINKDLFERCMFHVAKVLKESRMSMEDVSQVVLVGGSTRIPRVKQMLREFFGDREPITPLNPDEAVAYGAALYAAMMMGEKSDDLPQLIPMDVLPLSLGVDLTSGEMRTIIPKNSAIPATGSCVLATSRDNQTRMRFPVYEGEAQMTRDNHYLGEFTLDGFEPAPKGEASTEVTFRVDESGIVQATARALSLNFTPDKESTITISANKGRLTDEQVHDMMLNEITLAEDDVEEGEQ